MRLIDADELKKAIYEWRYHGYYDKLIETIDNAPTVDLQHIIKLNFARIAVQI